MRERYTKDLEMLLELQLEGNERVRAVVTAYEELAEEDKILFRLAAGISQDAAVRTREPEQQPPSAPTYRTRHDQLQPIVRDLLKTLLEDYPSLLTEKDIDNLMDRDYTQKILGLQLGGFPLLRRREAGRRGSDNDSQSRFYVRVYADRFYVCSQWWRDDHLDNAKSLLRFAGELAGRDPNHLGVPVLERHMRDLRDYIDPSE